MCVHLYVSHSGKYYSKKSNPLDHPVCFRQNSLNVGLWHHKFHSSKIQHVKNEQWWKIYKVSKQGQAPAGLGFSGWELPRPEGSGIPSGNLQGLVLYHDFQRTLCPWWVTSVQPGSQCWSVSGASVQWEILNLSQDPGAMDSQGQKSKHTQQSIRIQTKKEEVEKNSWHSQHSQLAKAEWKNH